MSQVDEDIEALRPELTAPLEEEPPPPRPVEPPADVRPDLAPNERAPLGAMGKAGLGVLVVGVAGLATGIVLLTQPTRERSMGLEGGWRGAGGGLQGGCRGSSNARVTETREAQRRASGGARSWYGSYCSPSIALGLRSGAAGGLRGDGADLRHGRDAAAAFEQ